MKETSSQPRSGPTRRILSFVSTVLLALAYVSPSIADDRTGLEYLIFRLEALPDDSPAPANLQNKLLALKEISGSAAPTGQGHTLVGEFGALGSAKERLACGLAISPKATSESMPATGVRSDTSLVLSICRK